MNTSADHKPALIKPFITQQIYSFILYLHTHTDTDTHDGNILQSICHTNGGFKQHTRSHTHTPTVCTHIAKLQEAEDYTRPAPSGQGDRDEGGGEQLFWSHLYKKKQQYPKKEVCHILCHLSHKQGILRFHVIFFGLGLLRCMCCAATNNKQRGTQGHCITMVDTVWTYSFKKEGAECRANRVRSAECCRTTSTLTVCVLLSSKTHLV